MLPGMRTPSRGVLEAATDVQHQRRVRPGQSLGELVWGDARDVVGGVGEQPGGGAGELLGQGLLLGLARVPAGERGGGRAVGDDRHQHHDADHRQQFLAAAHALVHDQQREQQRVQPAGTEPADEPVRA
jgi:hypothetical protein